MIVISSTAQSSITAMASPPKQLKLSSPLVAPSSIAPPTPSTPKKLKLDNIETLSTEAAIVHFPPVNKKKENLPEQIVTEKNYNLQTDDTLLAEEELEESEDEEELPEDLKNDHQDKRTIQELLTGIQQFRELRMPPKLEKENSPNSPNTQNDDYDNKPIELSHIIKTLGDRFYVVDYTKLRGLNVWGIIKEDEYFAVWETRDLEFLLQIPVLEKRLRSQEITIEMKLDGMEETTQGIDRLLLDIVNIYIGNVPIKVLID